MVKNIIIMVCILISSVAVLQSTQDAAVYDAVVSKQRSEIENLRYQLNQCKVLYIGL